MWADGQRESVLELIGAGVADREIARRTGVPRATVGYWRRNPHRPRRFRGGDPDWRPADSAVYCYLLGLYLGDGHIVRKGRSSRICITLDARHERLASEAGQALTTVFPDRPIARYASATIRKVELLVSDPSLPYAFPQCGPGKKHEREIRLVDWQLDLTHANPRALIRGLIHSDGCRSMNRFTTTLPRGRIATYEYPRYFFSNLSIAHRDSVALLDEFVGPKS
jgi:hypothetical protein